MTFRSFAFAALVLCSTGGNVQANTGCGEVWTVGTHDATTTRLSVVLSNRKPAVAVVLLVGGTGALRLDESGCPEALTGNALVRFLPYFQMAGLTTVLMDAPSDMLDGDGLAGFRTDVRHARDIGIVLEEVRRKLAAKAWLIGTSRGSISAVNAAAHLKGAQAPDGLVLAAVVSEGQLNGRKSWTAQTVFDLPLGILRRPTLLLGHANDLCPRSPPSNMEDGIAALIGASRKQALTLTGGPGLQGKTGLEACAGRTPHGFVGQEAEVAGGIVRFILDGQY